MDQDTKAQIRTTFQANMNRVKSLVNAYDALGTPGAGRPSVQQIDVLRSAVVLLHASLEDLIRSSSEVLLPQAAAEILDQIGFPDGPEKTKTKFSLGDLYSYKGQSVDDLIRTAVQVRLQRSNYNTVAEVAAALRRIGLEADLLDPDQATLESIMKRRHLIDIGQIRTPHISLAGEAHVLSTCRS